MPTPSWRVLAEPVLRIVAGRTANRHIGREPRIEIELAAQLDLRSRERVLIDALNQSGPGRQTKRQLEIERLVIVRDRPARR